MKAATLARDAQRRDALRLMLASLAHGREGAATAAFRRRGAPGAPARAQARVEASEAFRTAGRDEQAAKEDGELAILEECMPAQLTEEELERIVDDAIAENGCNEHPGTWVA